MEVRTGRDSDPVVERAARELASQAPEPNWVEISTSIISKVRATTRRTWPVDAEYPSPSSTGSDTLRISDQVVRTAVRSALAGVHGAEPTEISLYLDGHTCTGIGITVIGVYGNDLRAVGRDLADRALDALTEILGANVGAPIARDVDVHVVDLDPSDDGE